MTQPFQFANGQLAHSAEDLLKLCQEYPVDGMNYLVREDLEKWLAYIGQEDIARCAANARQTSLEDRQKLEEFLTKCHALSSPEPESVAETPVVESEPKPEPESVAETPVVESKPEPELEPVVETPVVESKPEPELEPVVETPVVESKPEPAPVKAQKSTPASNSEAKPSFFRAIAKLIVNVLYRNKN